MKKYLKKEHRSTIATNYQLRANMSSDILAHERTIQRWAVNDSPKLTSPHVLASFKKHSGLKIKDSELIIEESKTETHLNVA